MYRLPPMSNRTDTLFPDATLFLSQRRAMDRGRQPRAGAGDAAVRAGGGGAAAGAHLAVGGRGTWGVGRLRGGAARTPRWLATARRLDQPHRVRRCRAGVDGRGDLLQAASQGRLGGGRAAGGRGGRPVDRQPWCLARTGGYRSRRAAGRGLAGALSAVAVDAVRVPALGSGVVFGAAGSVADG